GDWGVQPLDQLISSLEAGVSVNSVDKEKDVYPHEESILKTSCVFGGKFLPQEHKIILPRDLHRAKLNPCKDSIVISRMNTPALVGECGYVDQDYPNLFLPDRLWMTRHQGRTDLSVRWLAYVLSSNGFGRFIKESATGTSGSMKNISKGSFLAVQVPMPTKIEQDAIAETLSDADALIESLEQLVAKKREIKQGAMQELLIGKKRLPGFEVIPGYKQTDVGVIPEDWEVKPLGALATLYQPITISAKQFTEAGFPVYGANGVVGFYSKSNHDTWQVIVTCRGSTCGTVNRTVDRCWITGNAMVLNCEQNKSLCKEFFYHLLNSQDLSDCITGTGQPQIVRSPLAVFCVPLPPTKAEQQAIAAILSDMDSEIAALEANLAKARCIKQGMMQELL